MRRIFTAIALLLLCGGWSVAQAEGVGWDMIGCKIELPNGLIYMKGETDPVAKLDIKLTLTNKTTIEDKTKKSVDVKRISWPSEEKLDEVRKFDLTEEQRKEFIQSLTKTTTVEVSKVNKHSVGYEYAPPQLGPHELFKIVVRRLPDPEVEGARKNDDGPPKPDFMERDMPVEHTDPSDLIPTAYLPAGETSPEFLLHVGNYFKISRPGTYTVKVIMTQMADTQTPSGLVESNEERFQVVPYKVVAQKIENLKNWMDAFERGHPDFDYMVYRLPVTAPYDEVYYVQRFYTRGIEHWEWHRLCSTVRGVPVQVKQISPKKLAILAQHFKGDAGLYTLDFDKIEPAVTAKILKLEGGKVPTLRVEGGEVSAE